jgi:hypothetical protein
MAPTAHRLRGRRCVSGWDQPVEGRELDQYRRQDHSGASVIPGSTAHDARIRPQSRTCRVRVRGWGVLKRRMGHLHPQHLDDEHGRPRSTPKPLGVHSGRGCHSTPTGGLQFGSQFEAVLGRPQRSGQGRWSSMNRSGWPRSELLMRHTVQHGSTATSPHSSQQRRPAAHSASCDDSQTSSGAASSGSRG